MSDAESEMYAAERNFATNMRLRREELGWSQGELSRRMRQGGWSNFHQTTVSRIEKHERPIRLSEAGAIARVLEIPLSLLELPEGVAHGVTRVRTALLDTEASGRRLTEAVDDYTAERTALLYEIEHAMPLLDSSTPDEAATQEELSALLARARNVASRDVQYYLAPGEEADDAIDPEA